MFATSYNNFYDFWLRLKVIPKKIFSLQQDLGLFTVEGEAGKNRRLI